MQEDVKGAAFKRDNVARMLLHLTAPEQLAVEEEKRLNQRGLRLAAARERLGSYVLLVMRRFGHNKLEGELFTLRMHQNPPSVEIRDELLIPPEYLVEKPPPPPRIDQKRYSGCNQSGQRSPRCPSRDRELPTENRVSKQPALPPTTLGLAPTSVDKPPQTLKPGCKSHTNGTSEGGARRGGMRLHAWIDGE
ncbi:MAG: siphovirus Gp157 family protein [Acidobacteriota bacterium]